MESRTINENKLYILCLSDVRGGVDRASNIIASYELQTLVDYYNEQKEPWVDENKEGVPDYYGNVHRYDKTFKKGSKLEWYNDVDNNSGLIAHTCKNSFGNIYFEWIEDGFTPNIDII